MAEIILGGLVGALLATALGSVFQFWLERQRLKADVMLEVMGWMAEAFRHAQDLQTHAAFEHSDPSAEFLNQDELRHVRRDLNRLLTPAELRVRVALVYGEGSELKLMDDFVTEIQAFVRMLIESGASNWLTVSKDLDRRKNEKLAPIMADLRRTFLRRASLPGWLLRVKVTSLHSCHRSRAACDRG